MNRNNNYITPIAKQKMSNPKHYSSLPKYLSILRILFISLTENYTFFPNQRYGESFKTYNSSFLSKDKKVGKLRHQKIERILKYWN